MKICGSIHADIELDAGSYFLVKSEADGKTLKIILTDSKRRPLTLRNVTHKQAFALTTQLHKMMMMQDQIAAERMITTEAETVVVDSRINEFDNFLAEMGL